MEPTATELTDGQIVNKLNHWTNEAKRRPLTSEEADRVRELRGEQAKRTIDWLRA